MPEPLKLNKKILIISSYAPPKINGGSIQLYNIFSNIRNSDYCILTSSKNFKSRENKFGQKLQCNYYYFEEKGVNGVLNFFLTIKNGIAVIKKEGVDKLIGISDNGKSFLLTFILAKICRRPYCIYILDVYRDNYIRPYFWRFLSIIFEPPLLSQADAVFVVNPSFKSYYAEVYPKLTAKLHVINVCAILESYAPKEDHKPVAPYKTLYTGSIYWLQERGIIDLIEAIHEIKDINICLDIYSLYPTDKIISLADGNAIKIKSANLEEIHKIQTQADILFAPLSWDGPSDTIIKTSIPSKITDYLMSGRPILIYAPADSYLSIYAKKEGFAMVVDRRDKEELKMAIKKLLFDTDYTHSLIQKAQETFWAHHEARKNSELFASYMNIQL